jgi:hypothetical protein
MKAVTVARTEISVRRQRIPHGEPELPEAEEDVAAPLALAQDLLRAATRKAIQDPVFRQVFGSEDTVHAQWPVDI